MKDERYKGHLAMLITTMLFGLNIPISKAVLGSGIPPFSLTLIRMCGGAILFWTVSLMQPREKVAWRDLGLLFFASVLGIQINQGAFVIGLSMTSTVDASIIATLTPILTMLFASLFLREPITWVKGAGVAIGATGALLLIMESAGGQGLAGGHVTGNLLCILSSIGFAAYLTVFKPLISRYSPITLMKWMFLYATVCCLPFGYRELSSIDFVELPWQTVSGAIYIVFMATFICYMLIPVAQKLLRPTVVSMYNYLQPIVASLVAVAIGMDSFSWGKGLAAALVFLGVWVVTKSKSRAQLDALKGVK